MYSFVSIFPLNHHVRENHPYCYVQQPATNAIPLYGYIELFIHSKIDTHLDCFQLQIIRNKAAMNIPTYVFLLI